MKNLLIVLMIALSFNAYANTCRSSKVKHKFDVMHGYPHGRLGYIVDHICSLYNGGIDDVRNLQYQTISESRAKDKIENTAEGKRRFCNSKNSTPTRQVFNCK